MKKVYYKKPKKPVFIHNCGKVRGLPCELIGDIWGLLQLIVKNSKMFPPCMHRSTQQFFTMILDQFSHLFNSKNTLKISSNSPFYSHS